MRRKRTKTGWFPLCFTQNRIMEGVPVVIDSLLRLYNETEITHELQQARIHKGVLLKCF